MSWLSKIMDALERQIKISESLAQQQAMPDDFWIQETEQNRKIIESAKGVLWPSNDGTEAQPVGGKPRKENDVR